MIKQPLSVRSDDCALLAGLIQHLNFNHLEKHQNAQSTWSETVNEKLVTAAWWRLDARFGSGKDELIQAGIVLGVLAVFSLMVSLLISLVGWAFGFGFLTSLLWTFTLLLSLLAVVMFALRGYFDIFPAATWEWWRRGRVYQRERVTFTDTTDHLLKELSGQKEEDLLHLGRLTETAELVEHLRRLRTYQQFLLKHRKGINAAGEAAVGTNRYVTTSEYAETRLQNIDDVIKAAEDNLQRARDLSGELKTTLLPAYREEMENLKEFVVGLSYFHLHEEDELRREVERELTTSRQQIVDVFVQILHCKTNARRKIDGVLEQYSQLHEGRLQHHPQIEKTSVA